MFAKSFEEINVNVNKSYYSAPKGEKIPPLFHQ